MILKFLNKSRVNQGSIILSIILISSCGKSSNTSNEKFNKDINNNLNSTTNTRISKSTIKWQLPELTA